KRGVDQDAGGRISARLEEDPFCFRNSIHCAVLDDISEDNAKVLLAILWSSLTRYFLFMTSGTWGLWHDEVHQDVIYGLPVRFPKDAGLTKRIVEVVDKLRELPEVSEQKSLFAVHGMPKHERDKLIDEMEHRLDQAIYDVFELRDDERERIEELCDLDLDL